MSRRTLTDGQWARIEPLVPGRPGDRGRTGADNRLFVDACLWLARGAAPWRDLPPELGHWKSVHTRFRRWSRAGVWDEEGKETIQWIVSPTQVFKALSTDPDFEYVLIDATISKVHADATSQKGDLKLTPSDAREAA